MRTTTYHQLQKLERTIHIMSPLMALSLTLVSSNYPCLEHILMVPKMFEPLDFDCTLFICYRCVSQTSAFIRQSAVLKRRIIAVTLATFLLLYAIIGKIFFSLVL